MILNASCNGIIAKIVGNRRGHLPGGRVHHVNGRSSQIVARRGPVASNIGNATAVSRQCIIDQAMPYRNQVSLLIAVKPEQHQIDNRIF